MWLFKKEILCTNNIETYSKIIGLLGEHQIPYKTKVKSNDHQKGLVHLYVYNREVSGLNMKYMKNYYIYVKKEDYEKAKYLLSL